MSKRSSKSKPLSKNHPMKRIVENVKEEKVKEHLKCQHKKRVQLGASRRKRSSSSMENQKMVDNAEHCDQSFASEIYFEPPWLTPPQSLDVLAFLLHAFMFAIFIEI